MDYLNHFTSLNFPISSDEIPFFSYAAFRRSKESSFAGLTFYEIFVLVDLA